jgi:hypothetical protein
MLVYAMFAAAAVAVAPATIDRPLLLDGRCDEPQWRRAAPIDLGKVAVARFLQDREHLHLCISLPPESLGTMDLYFLNPRETGEVNLHLSGQRGERRRNPDGSWPDLLWETQRDWYGNVVVTDWTREKGWGDPIPSEARELQIRKLKLGGPGAKVRLMFQVRHIKDASGRRGSVVFPAGASQEDSGSWATLRLR